MSRGCSCVCMMLSERPRAWNVVVGFVAGFTVVLRARRCAHPLTMPPNIHACCPSCIRISAQRRATTSSSCVLETPKTRAIAASSTKTRSSIGSRIMAGCREETLSMAPAKTVRSSTQSYGGGSQCLYARLVFLPCLLCAGCYPACQTKGSTQKSQEQ